MRSAKENIDKREYNTAIVQLKNVLQAAPDNGPARLLLGEAHLSARDPVSAEKELRRALELSQPHEKVLPLYSRALLDQGKFDAVISEVERRALFDPKAVAATQTALGDSYAAKADSHRAYAAYETALSAVPGYPPARLGRAILAAAAGKVEQSLQEADEIISADPKMAAAHALRSDVLLLTGRRDEAKAALEQAIAVDGEYLPARFSLISVLIDEKAFDQAVAQLNAVRKVAPRDLRATYFDALLAFRKGEVSRARELVLQVLKYLPNHVSSLVLAGTVELSLNQLASAESYLNRAVKQAPNNLEARRSLIVTQLRLGQPARAQDTLQGLIERGVPRDQKLLLLAGETYLANGDVKRASAFFQAAATMTDVQQVAAKTRLGQIALATGNKEEGFKELEAASGLDAGQHQADLALITAHLQRREFDQAMAAVQALEKKQPKNPMTFQMYGVVHLAKGDTNAARRNFERALELQPNYLPAAQNLAMIDLLEKRPEDAGKRYEAMIAKDPKNDRIYLALADLQVRSGADPKQIGATAQRAVDANPQSVPARLALIEFHLRNKDPRAALTAAQSADAALPNERLIVEALGVAQERAGEFNQAVETYNRLALLEPHSTRPLERLASLYVQRKDWEKAIEALRRMQKVVPKASDLVPQVVQVYMAADRAEDALKEVRELRKREPKNAAGWSLEGDIHTAQKNWPEAAKAYREALRRAPQANLIAIRLHAALSSAGKNQEADALAQKWNADNPKDVAMSLYLGDRELAAKSYKAAVGHYQAVLARAPNHAPALNNLAISLDELGDAKALGYAERAVKVAPNNAAILDTAGALLMKRGQTKQGIEHLERATKLAPNRHEIRLHYAKALIKAGQKEAARKELDVLQRVKEEYPGKADVAALLKSL